MLTRKQGWLLAGMVTALVLAGGALKFWQSWQRSHFDCRGEVQVFTQNSRADLTVRHIFDGNKGVAVMRGVLTPDKGEPLGINHNVWFSFTQQGDEFFLYSQNVTSNVSGSTTPEGLESVLPAFYLKTGEPFYLHIVRIDDSNRQISTSRVPSMLCKP